ncbi:MAG: spore maturation protein [Oscillospiraceae bacterium]|jgi:spore maturation protein B|nr:spore maturation protein [Oscillospiraceae bacterium]
MNFSSYVIPAFIAIIVLAGLIKKVDVFSVFVEGAEENLKVCISILPTLAALMLCIGMFKASGALNFITAAISPLINNIGFPAECVPLALIRPLSGSGALAVYEGILSEHSPDSFVGRVASVLLGSTETTFYTVTVYFGAAKIKKLRHTVPSALAGDITGFIMSALLVRVFFGEH